VPCHSCDFWFCRTTLTRDKVAACDFIVARCDFDAAFDKQTWLPAIRMTLRQSGATKSQVWHATNSRCVLYIKAGATNMAGAWFIHRLGWPVRPVHGLYRQNRTCFILLPNRTYVLFCYRLPVRNACCDWSASDTYKQSYGNAIW